jgi:DNA-binding transcriptional ArsR family regulator
VNETNGGAAAFEPARELVVSDLETLRVVADPLRMQILEVTLEAPRTVKEIAATLRTTPGKLYYHVNMLEEHGLLRVAGTRIVSGIIEKRYRVAARSLRPDRVLLDPAGAGHDEVVDLLLSSILETTRRDLDTIRAAVGSGIIDLAQSAPIERRVQVVKTLGRLTHEQVTAFSEQLHALVREFGTLAALNTTDQGYSLTIMFHPIQLGPDDWTAPGDSAGPASAGNSHDNKE